MSETVPSYLEVRFASIWQQQYPSLVLVAEYVPARPRRYRVDFADPDRKIGIEIQGGIWSRRSGHAGGTGITRDAEKFCFLAAIGWRIFPLTDRHLFVGSPQLKLVAHTIRHSSVCLGYSNAQLATILDWDDPDRVVAARMAVKSADRSRVCKYWKFCDTNCCWQSA